MLISGPTCTWVHMQLHSHPHTCAGALAHTYVLTQASQLPVRMDSWEQGFLNLSDHHHFLDNVSGKQLNQNPHRLGQRMVLLVSDVLCLVPNTQKGCSLGVRWLPLRKEARGWWAASCCALYTSLLFGSSTIMLY